MPVLSDGDAVNLMRLRHPEWTENQKRWRFLADSLEGGNRYRHADYAADPTRVNSRSMGMSSGGVGGSNFGQVDATTGQSSPFGYGQIVDRNLVPHLSEMSEDGKDVYLLRLARTPVPKTLERVIRRHLGRIYAREVKREGGAGLTEWWEDVDGQGTPIDKWMRKIVAPLLSLYGCLDLYFDHPEAEESANTMTRSDLEEAGLAGCVADYVLPENMVWWRLDRRRRGRYLECLVIERDDAGNPCYRHWTATDSTIYRDPTSPGSRVIRTIPHPFGQPPIVRVFDEPKYRSRNIGQPRYESIAELQKAIYNGWSELILQDVLQSSPQLQGHEKYLTEDNKVEIGPDHVLPIFVSPNGQVVPWSYVDPPKGAAQEQLAHIREFGDLADRDAALMKPAGMTSAGSTGQSGLSKAFDSQDSNDYLAEVSETLGDAERTIAEFALLVLFNGPASELDLESVRITYPKEFDLFTAEDLAAAIADIQGLAAAAGALPQIESELIKRLIRILLPGVDDPTLKAMGLEVDSMIQGKANDREMTREAGVLVPYSGPSSVAESSDQSNLAIANMATA